MPPKSDLLEKMRASKSGWKRKDLDALYESYGFEIRHGSSHDVAKHPDYPQIRVTLPRHGTLKKYLVTQAVKNIDKLTQLQQEEKAEKDIIGNDSLEDESDFEDENDE